MSQRFKPKILVSDDDLTMRLLARQCLESEGMVVVEAENGLEAIDMFVEERPDLVFLDVEMPGMSGLDACRRIRSLPDGKAVPIMIVTGSDDRDSIDQGYDAGATQYKTKPVNWSLLGRDVQFMLRASTAFNSLKRQEDRLRFLAYFDPLTNLPNRRSFNEQLNRILKRAERLGTYAALLFIDLDNFKRINDSIGHGRGDRLLVEIARRLSNELRSDDAVSYFSDALEESGAELDGSTEIARLGGDEFTVVLSDVTAVIDIERVARRIISVLSEPIALQSHNPVVTPSIGIAIYPQDGTDGDSLVRNADTAMYVAKAAGRACFRFYDEEMNARSIEHLKMEEDLRTALACDQLELHYQPQVSSESGRIVSFEALLRWRHPERGMVSPADFIPIAEQTGQIIEIGNWVMRQVGRDYRAWEAAGLRPFRLCVNISPLQFNQPDLVQTVDRMLREASMDSTRLELELTEGAIMNDAESNTLKLGHLTSLGLELAVDDFGTGYSSLSYLKRFPITTLKIDKSFIADMESPDGRAIVEAIIALSHALKLRSIAEGVETEYQLRILLERGCDLLQGFLFAKAIPASEVAAALEADFLPLIEDQLAAS